MMGAERIARLRTWFDRASSADPVDRSSVLDELGAQDPVLRRELEELLEYDDRTGSGFSEPLAVEIGGRLHSIADGFEGRGNRGFDDSAVQRHPNQIGAYRVVRQLGHGGSGVVFEAEQERPHRRVAVKVLRKAFATPSVRRRFEHEAHFLGQLDHPGIARVYESGTTDIGVGAQPFLAMELVDGVPLTSFVEAHELDWRARLELIARIGDAVHHAHLQGIIHRDLKPANVLVCDASDESGGAVGRPKVLDFGVARAVGTDLHVSTVETVTGQLVGTVPYMSPEQASGDHVHVDARTDVYALGVVAYEVLTGSLPLDVSGHLIPEAVRIIREEEPTRLGTINRLYRGDVETIVAKALEKEPDRRYESVAALTTDIRRCLADEPILARPPSTRYLLSRFARRNRLLVAATAAGLVLLIGAVAGTSYGLIKANQREQTAVAALSEAERVTGFLERMLQAVGGRGRGHEARVLDMLDEASASIGPELEAFPATEARLRQVIAHAYAEIGRFADAEPHIQRAFDLRLRELGPDHETTLRAEAQRNQLYVHREDIAGGLEPVRAMHERLLDRLGADHDLTLQVAADLAGLHRHDRNFVEAERLLVDTHDRMVRTLGAEHDETLGVYHNLGAVYIYQGRLNEAEAVLLEVLETNHRLHGDDHVATFGAMHMLATVYTNRGELDEAATMRERALDACEAMLGETHKYTMAILAALARDYQALKQYDLAVEVLERATERYPRAEGATRDGEAGYWNQLAVVCRRAKRFDRAESCFQRAIDLRIAELGRDHRDVLVTECDLALLRQDQGRWAEAETIFVRVLDLHRRDRPHDKATSTCANNLARLYVKTDRPQRAVSLFDEALAGARHPDSYGPTHARTRLFMLNFGECLTELERLEEAEGLLHEAHDLNQTERSRTLLVKLYRRWERPDAARTYEVEETAAH